MITSHQVTKQFLRAFWRQGIDAKLAVVCLASPAMLVFGPVVDEKEDPCGGQALYQAVEEGLSLGVDPVKILEDKKQRLDLALSMKQTLDGLQGPLTPL